MSGSPSNGARCRPARKSGKIIASLMKTETTSDCPTCSVAIPRCSLIAGCSARTANDLFRRARSSSARLPPMPAT